jgi:hypothetical protein
MVARFSIPALILIVRVPARPSRLNDMSMPSTRRNVCARRSRLARAPGFFGPGKTAGGTPKVRGSSRPAAAFGHEFADANRHRAPLETCAFRRSRPEIPSEAGRPYRLKSAGDSDDPGHHPRLALVAASSSGTVGGLDVKLLTLGGRFAQAQLLTGQRRRT